LSAPLELHPSPHRTYLLHKRRIAECAQRGIAGCFRRQAILLLLFRFQLQVAAHLALQVLLACLRRSHCIQLIRTSGPAMDRALAARRAGIHDANSATALRRWRRCYSTTRTTRQPKRSAQAWWLRHSAPPRRETKRLPNRPPTDCRYTASDLLADLATLTRNRVRVGEQAFDMLAPPTAVQQWVFELLQVRP